MPSIITHSYFMKDVYEKLPLSKKIFLQNEIRKTDFFSQGIDLLQHYICLNKKKQKKIKSFSNYFHKNKTSEFIITMINYIKYNYYKDNPEIIIMLYSLISHYVIDYKINPFIYYKSGVFEKNNKLTYKYNSKLIETETFIDSYLIKVKEKVAPHKYKHFKNIFPTISLSKETIEVINFSFKETYNINNFSRTWLKSIKKAKKFYKIARYDRLGVKKTFYYLIDKITARSCKKLQNLSYKTTPQKKDLLNLSKKTWYYPTSKRKKSTKSFIELYTEAIDSTIKLIEKVDQYIYDDKKTNLNILFKDYSYITGIELNKPQEMKFFEF